MQADAIDPSTASAPKAGMRSRILDAASELFYSQGIRATSADRIIEQVGITKVTFYRHFRTKSDLVVAYLGQQASREQAWMASVVRVGEPSATLRALAAGIGDASCVSGFRGCAFINAAAEFGDPEDPVRLAVDAHRRWMRDYFAEIAVEAGSSDAASAAEQLMILRDGAMVNGYLGEPGALAAALEAGFLSVLATKDGRGD